MLTLWVYSSPLWTHTTKLGNNPWGDVWCSVLCREGFASVQQNNQQSQQTNDECLFCVAVIVPFCQCEHVFIITSWLVWSVYYLYLCCLPGRWRYQQAGTCDPPACWDTRPPGQQRAPDTWPTRCNTSCCCASLPCSAARSDGGQETSGSPLLSWEGEEKDVFFFGHFFFYLTR